MFAVEPKIWASDWNECLFKCNILLNFFFRSLSGWRKSFYWPQRNYSERMCSECWRQLSIGLCLSLQHATSSLLLLCLVYWMWVHFLALSLTGNSWARLSFWRFIANGYWQWVIFCNLYVQKIVRFQKRIKKKDNALPHFSILSKGQIIILVPSNTCTYRMLYRCFFIVSTVIFLPKSYVGSFSGPLLFHVR